MQVAEGLIIPEHNHVVIPAQAGIHATGGMPAEPWVPAFAGMTK